MVFYRIIITVVKTVTVALIVIYFLKRRQILTVYFVKQKQLGSDIIYEKKNIYYGIYFVLVCILNLLKKEARFRQLSAQILLI